MGLNLLIKPTSSLCNIACSYCFYLDEASNRSFSSYDMMSEETAELLIKKAFTHSKRFVNFMFQGGEPTLIGIDFFRKFHQWIELYNKANIPVSFSLQTNGLLLTEEWAELFKKYDYLIGISLDGLREVHNKFRVQHHGKETFDGVLKGIEILRSYDVPFNILTVVTNELAQKGVEVLDFYKKQKFEFLQFIPCIDPIQSSSNTFLEATMYEKFLEDTFLIYKQNLLNNTYISIRYFDNIVGYFLGRPYESCDMQGVCSLNTVVESNGNVYPCDFYALDEYCLGNIHQDSFHEILQSPIGRDFCASSRHLPKQCNDCPYLNICRGGGCRRYRSEDTGHHRFCSAYFNFFEKYIVELKNLAQHIINTQKP